MAEGIWRAENILGLTALVLDGEHQDAYAVILAGVHGEEPAPPVAVMSMLPEMEYWGVPLIVFPSANPAGLAIKERLPEWTKDEKGDKTSPLASVIFREVLQDGRDIGMFLDLHEDDQAPGPYIFGHNGTVAALELRNLLYAIGVPFPDRLKSWWEENQKPLPIEGGVVWDYIDGSVDDLMSETGAVTLVVETPTAWDLDRRVLVHSRVLSHVPILYDRFCR